jgi:hypothetical protein
MNLALGGQGGLGGPGGSSGNGGDGQGGGVFIGPSVSFVNLFNSTIAENYAQAGGAGPGSPGTPPTTPGFPGSAAGGGVFNNHGDVNAVSSLIEANLAAIAPDYDGIFNSAGHNLVGVSNGSNLSGASPDVNGNLFGTAASPLAQPLRELGNYGGPTETFALLAPGPAVNAGINPFGLTTDQRGFGPRDAGGGVDIGAFQLGAQALTSPGAQTSNEGDTVSLKISDPDADPNSFTAMGLPPGLSISPAGVISGTVGAQAAGTYTVTVSDAESLVAVSTSFTWTVNDTTPPTLTSPGDQTSNEGDTVNLATAAQDADTFSATGLPTGLSISPGEGVITGAITAQTAGTYAVTVSASDDGHVGSTTSSWVVNGTAPPMSNAQVYHPIRVSPVKVRGRTMLEVFDAMTGALVGKVAPFSEPHVRVQVLTADVTGNGRANLIALAVINGRLQVRIYDGLTLAPL